MGWGTTVCGSGIILRQCENLELVNDSPPFSSSRVTTPRSFSFFMLRIEAY